VDWEFFRRGVRISGASGSALSSSWGYFDVDEVDIESEEADDREVGYKPGGWALALVWRDGGLINFGEAHGGIDSSMYNVNIALPRGAE
jgi:hypothetical protein